MQSDQVRLAVDQELCIGSGSCELLEEAVFLVDDDSGIAAIIGDGTLSLVRAQVVIDRCPASAISIVDE